MSARYAIYFAPKADSPLARFGAAWLGRDAESDTAPVRPAVDGFMPERLDAITATPRNYGFHATIAPPRPMAPGATPLMLDGALQSFAAGQQPIDAPPLLLTDLDGFLAFMLSDACEEVRSLAGAVVEVFDPFRAAPTEAELARRRAAGLTRTQETLLRRWGYPYVMEEYRFHMTLTGRLEEPERSALRRALEPLTASCCAQPLSVDGLALFEQTNRQSPFRLVRRYAFGASAKE